MFKNLKTWFVLSLLVFNFSPAHLDESLSDGSDSDNSSGGSSGSEEPCAKEANNKKNEAGDMMICQESNPTTTCTCELVQGFQAFLSLLNPCQQALLQQWLAQVQQQVLVMTSWTVNQRFVQFQQSLQLFGQQFPDIWQIISYQTIRAYGRNTFKVKDCQDVAMSFIDEVSASFGNLDQNNNCALFQGLNAVASQCGASTTVAGSTASGTPTGSTGTPTGSSGSTVSGSTATPTGSTATPTGSSGSTASGSTGTPSGSTGTPNGSAGTGLPAACAGYYTSAGTTVGGSTGTATTGTATGSTGTATGSTATGSTGTATGSTGTATTGTATGSTGTATTGTATGSTGTATTGTATGSTGTVTGSTGTATTGTVTGSTGTAPMNCSDLSNQITILIGQLTIIFQNTGYTYQQQMVQVYLKFQAFFAQFPQYQQIILSGSISGSFSISIQTFFSLTLSYQQASTISTVFTGDVSVCPVMVALQGACQQSICPATAAGSTATGSTATATGSTATGSTATGSTATGSTATGSTATGSTATGSTATGSTATASGSTGSTASSGTTPSGSTGSTPSSGTTPSGNGSCIPLQFQQELLAFYDELKTIFNSNSDPVYRQKMFAKLYYHYCNDLPGIDQFLDSISCGNGFTFQQIIYVSAIISFPQISVTNIDQLINATGIGWNATGLVAAGRFWQANANVTFNFQGLGFGATQWVVYRNVYINNNISLIIVDTSLTTRQKHIKICGVLQKFISTYSQQQFFWCMPFIGGIFNGTMADYFRANKVANPGCNIPHGCFQQRNQLVNIKSDGTTDFTNAWNNMVSAQTAANQASLASFTAQVNSTVYGATGSGGQWAQIYQLTLIITQAKAAVPSISSSIDSTLVGKWGHFKKFCDCQTSAGNLQNYPGK